MRPKSRKETKQDCREMVQLLFTQCPARHCHSVLVLVEHGYPFLLNLEPLFTKFRYWWFNSMIATSFHVSLGSFSI